jgi:Malectin domain/Fibronectin type III domain
MSHGRHRYPALVIVVGCLSWISLTASPALAVDVQLAWDRSPSPQATGYLLYYGTASGQYSVSLDTGQATTAAVSGLQAGQTYYFAVLAYDVSGNHSPFSNEAIYDSTQAGITFAVHAGGDAYTDASDLKYQADTRFSGGDTYTTSAAIAGTMDDALYQSERYGNFSYTIPVANGDYVVTLKFAEIYWTRVGQRVFNVFIGQEPVLRNFDIVARVGPSTAYDVSVPAHVSNGVLTLSFESVVDDAKVSALVVRPATLVFAVNAGGQAYTGANGLTYQADARFSGGGTFKTSAAIAGTPNDPLYQSERYGKTFSYSIPVPSGDYLVTLKFAEIYWTQAGQRVFNVLVQGTTVLSKLDLIARVGPKAAYDVSVPAHVTTGPLTLTFQAVINNAKVSAIEVVRW